MEILDTLLRSELVAIQKDGELDSAHRWECIINVNGIRIDAFFVNEVELNRQYFQSFTDVLRVSATVPGGQYVRYIVPNREKLEVTLRRIPLSSDILPRESRASAITETTYIGTLYESDAETMTANTSIATNTDRLDAIDTREVHLRLRDKTMEGVRKRTVGGVFLNTTGANLIRTLLSVYSKIDGDDTKTAIDGVDISPGFSTEVREHLVIPHLTKLTDFPKKVNEICGGVYSTDFRYYLQGKMWYVYSPYDINKFDKGYKTLTIIKMPGDKMATPEKTYRLTDTQVIMLSTGLSSYTDLSENSRLNEGAGIRFADATRVLSNFISVKDNKASINKRDNVTEAVNEKIADDKNNLVSQSAVKFTSQYNLEYSKIAGRNGAIINVPWESANVEHLFPGMGVRYMFVNGNTVSEVKGVLLSVASKSTPTNMNAQERRFTQKAVLTIFVDRKVKPM